MASIPTTQSQAREPTQSLDDRFDRLAAIWLAETAYVSSSSDLVAHPAFREIVDMGPAIVPRLLRELEKTTVHWHRALRRITGADPVSPADRGNIEKSAAAWLSWAREQGYKW